MSLLGNLSDLHLPIWALMAWMIVLGTIVPFFLIVGSMRHITATRAGILAMVEPVVASLVAYGWLDETPRRDAARRRGDRPRRDRARPVGALAR